METSEKFEGWCILEVFGHQQFAGYVSEQSVGGASFIRIDVPALPAAPAVGYEAERPAEAAFTKLFGAAAIYGITPVSEEVARLVAARARKKPVNTYLPELYPRETTQAPMLMEPDDEGPDEDGWLQAQATLCD